MPGNRGACAWLGYPPDARLLILSTDDFGLCHAHNEGTLRAIEDGLATSCSLMMPAPWSGHAIHLLKENPRIPFGVHLTLVSEYVNYRWKPLTPFDRVPSLLDESGYFPLDNRYAELLMHADPAEVEREYRAQIEAVLATGLQPTHLDSHYGTHELRESLFDMTVGLAIEYGMALRVGRKDGVEKLRARGLPAIDHRVTDCGRIDPGRKVSILTKALRALPSGLSEWAMHPAIVTGELEAIMSSPLVEGVSATPEGRRSSLEFMTSERVAAIAEEEGIEFLSYAPLQRLWAAHGRGGVDA